MVILMAKKKKVDLKNLEPEEQLKYEIAEELGLLDKVVEEGEVYSKEILYWMGYLYRYWHYYTKESSSKIYKQAPVGAMKRNYLMFHTMDSSMAIDDLKEIYIKKRGISS